jgi:hypothetical protein
MTSKVYPRLELKKLRRIADGKRPFKNSAEKRDYVSIFESNFNCDNFMCIDKNGRLCDVVDNNVEDINLTFEDVMALRKAIINGNGPKFFAELVEMKAHKMGILVN